MGYHKISYLGYSACYCPNFEVQYNTQLKSTVTYETEPFLVKKLNFLISSRIFPGLFFVSKESLKRISLLQHIYIHHHRYVCCLYNFSHELQSAINST